MKFPAPSVDIEAIKQKYHVVVAQHGVQPAAKEQPKEGRRGSKP